ncbi:MAG: FG-GAP repeat domain-containing protein [Verrucomicrobiaceae bacterium]
MPAQVSETPTLQKSRYDKDLSDAYDRIDPLKDGWTSEELNEQFGHHLKEFVHRITDPEFKSVNLNDETLSATPLRPSSLENVTVDQFVIQRGTGLPEKFASAPIPDLKGHSTKVKVVTIEPLACTALITFKKPGHQVNATWKCTWTPDLELKSLQVLDYEEVTGPPLLRDITESVLGDVDSYHEQLLRSTDHWRLRLPRDFGLDAPANHGLALGDINGDGLEDLYLCQQGGLPNRLYLQNDDGTLRDFSVESKTDILDYCASALIIDLDNDGDKDLVVSQDFKILFFDNLDGKGHFELVFGQSTRAQSFSLTAADVDVDGFLDVYICGYNPSYSSARAGALGEPIPFHDANNGGPNMLWRNLGNWNFEDIAEKTGLDANNTRFSFAASFEDYDNDGDLDLYVANDFGRNCLYQNQGIQKNGLPFFKNIAESLEVEDTSAGMSSNWGDINRDGHMDLYVSNMFSSAGNRITFQSKFKQGVDDSIRSHYQRMARGNTLFQADGKGGFKDIAMESHTTMARWCWGSTFTDLNNDGWQDILAANGFITAEDTGDL